MDAIAAISEPKTAAHLLDPLRARILAVAREPMSASQVAERVGLPRQRVNYHVRQLAKAGLLREAGRRERRNLTEVLYAASAQRYVVDTRALGALAPDPAQLTEKAGLDYLVAVAARTQHEASAKREEAPPVTLTVDVEVKLAGGTDRAAFARALQEAVTGVAARFDAGQGEAWRVVATCYQKPRPE